MMINKVYNMDVMKVHFNQIQKVFIKIDIIILLLSNLYLLLLIFISYSKKNYFNIEFREIKLNQYQNFYIPESKQGEGIY